MDSEFIKKGFFEKAGYEIFKNCEKYYEKYKSFMSVSQMSFLLGLIKNYQFQNSEKIKNIIEIGTLQGVNSLYMLKNSNSDTNLYVIDLLDNDWIGRALIKEASENELKRLHLNKGKTALDIEEIIKNDVKLDLIFIDAEHSHPYPLIDLLCVLPFTHKESIVCLDDIGEYYRPYEWGANFIYTAWEEEKYRNINIFNGSEETLGVIKMYDDIEKFYETILKVAKISFKTPPWDCGENILGITDDTLNRLEAFCFRHYDKKFTD